MRLIVGLLAIPTVVVVHLAATAALAFALRVRFYAVSLGFGPAVFRGVVGDVNLILRLIPFGGYVGFEPDEPEIKDDLGPKRRRFASVSPVTKVLLYGAGVAGTLMLSAILLGPAPAAESFARAFGQILGGAMDPLGQGQENLRALVRLLSTSPLSVCAGVLAAKMSASNALPLPPLSGFQVLHMLLLRGREGRWLTWALNLGVLVLLLLLASYGVAVVSLVF